MQTLAMLQFLISSSSPLLCMVLSFCVLILDFSLGSNRFPSVLSASCIKDQSSVRAVSSHCDSQEDVTPISADPNVLQSGL